MTACRSMTAWSSALYLKMSAFRAVKHPPLPMTYRGFKTHVETVNALPTYELQWHASRACFDAASTWTHHSVTSCFDQAASGTLKGVASQHSNMPFWDEKLAPQLVCTLDLYTRLNLVLLVLMLQNKRIELLMERQNQGLKARPNTCKPCSVSA